jgi:hypothetical protein
MKLSFLFNNARSTVCSIFPFQFRMAFYARKAVKDIKKTLDNLDTSRLMIFCVKPRKYFDFIKV